MTGAWTATLGIAGWAALWWLPWQAWLPLGPGLRVALATLLFCLPGACAHALLDECRALRLALRLPAGFALSLCLTGALGLAGSLLHLPSRIVADALFVAGCAGIALLCRRGGFELERPAGRGRDVAIDAGLLVVAGTVAALLAWGRIAGADDLTYTARIAAFLERPTLGFEQIVFDTGTAIAPRYWLAFWSLGEAIVAAKSGVHPLRLDGACERQLLALLALAASFALARRLGFARRWAAAIVTAQVATLVFWSSGRYAPGSSFFNRLTEDKFLVLFLLAPTFFALAIDALEQRKRGAMIAAVAAWVAIAFAHPTSLGMVFVATGLFLAIEATATRRLAAPLRLFVAILVVTGGVGLLRFAPHPYQSGVFFDVDSAVQAHAIGNRAARVSPIRGTRFYGISSLAGGRFARAVGAVALLVALARWRKERAARLALSILLLLAAAVVPYTGWLLGLVLTPFHLWRIASLAPGAILIAFADAGRGLSAAPCDGFAGREDRAASAALGLAGAALLAASLSLRDPARAAELDSIALGRRASTMLASRCGSNQAAAIDIPFRDLEAMSEKLRRRLARRTVIVGDTCVNDLIPSLSAQAVLVTYRSPSEMANHSARPLAEERLEFGLHAATTRPETAPAEVARYLRERNVELVLSTGHEAWLEGLARDPSQLELVDAAGMLRLYRVVP